VQVTGIRRAWDRAPILYKVLVGNAIVIIVGAIGGTYLTQHLLMVSGHALALFFATVGIALSLIINYSILRNALRPMDALQRTVERIDRGDTAVRAPVEEIGDPQLQRFAHALNTMLGRLAAHTRMIEANRAQVRRLSGQVLSAQEDERKRLARELHDDTSGALARVLLNVEMCEDLLPEGLPEIREKMRATRVLSEQTLENVRKMIFDLRPTLLDDLGLAAAVRWYAKSNLEPVGIQVQFEASGNLGRGSATVETAMFRIAQEAVTNIIRHANARHARIQLTREPSRWVLIVQDDGRGFDVSAERHESTSDHRWGLFGVQERVALLGGTYHIQSGAGEGTTLRVEIPVE
jgi:two-component system sensor histidine kinase UhpB